MADGSRLYLLQTIGAKLMADVLCVQNVIGYAILRRAPLDTASAIDAAGGVKRNAEKLIAILSDPQSLATDLERIRHELS